MERLHRHPGQPVAIGQPGPPEVLSHVEPGDFLDGGDAHPQPFQVLQCAGRHGLHVGVHRQVAAEVTEPGHPATSHLLTDEPGERRRILPDRQGSGVAVAGHGAQQERQVQGAAGDGPVDPTLVDELLAVVRDPPEGGPQAEDVVPPGRVAQRPHEVTAVGDRQHTQGHRDGRPSTAASGRPGLVVGVGGRAEDIVVGL